MRDKVKFIKALSAALVMATAACAPLEMTSQFDPAEVSYIKNRGSATVSGQAFLRQKGGGVVTCAGTGAALIPAGTYATELFTKAWGNPNQGVAGAFTPGPASAPPEFLEYARKAQCDAEGDFEFKGVPNGEYYLISKVTWTVGSNIVPEGGIVGKRIRVTGGRSQRVLISG